MHFSSNRAPLIVFNAGGPKKEVWFPDVVSSVSFALVKFARGQTLAVRYD